MPILMKGPASRVLRPASSAFRTQDAGHRTQDYDSRFSYAAMMSSIFGGCFVTNASPYAAPISAPKCLPRASIMSRKPLDEMYVSGSFDFGLWNCDLNAATARIFVSHDALPSTTKLGVHMSFWK